jgi:hypothetical protein
MLFTPEVSQESINDDRYVTIAALRSFLIYAGASIYGRSLDCAKTPVSLGHQSPIVSAAKTHLRLIDAG